MAYTLGELEDLDSQQLAELLNRLDRHELLTFHGLRELVSDRELPRLAHSTFAITLADSLASRHLASHLDADLARQPSIGSQLFLLGRGEPRLLVSRLADSDLAAKLSSGLLARRLAKTSLAGTGLTEAVFIDTSVQQNAAALTGFDDPDLVQRLAEGPFAEEIANADFLDSLFTYGLDTTFASSGLARILEHSELAAKVGSAGRAAVVVFVAQRTVGALAAAIVELVVLRGLLELGRPVEQVRNDSQVARVALLGPEIGESARILEPALTGLQRVLDDTMVPLDKTTELYLRAQVGTIREQHRSVDEVDLTIVNRAIGNIVARLLEIHQVGSGVRALMTELGTEPPQIIDTVIARIDEALKNAARLQVVDLNIENYGREAATPIASAAAAAETAAELVDTAAQAWQRDTFTKFREGFETQLGKRTADASLSGLILLSALMVSRYGAGLEEVMIHFSDLLRQLQSLYLVRR